MAAVPPRSTGGVRRALLAVILLLVLAGAAVLVSLRLATTHVPAEASPALSPDEASIRRLVTDYWTGLANVDGDRIVATLCPDDAQGYLDTAYTDDDWGPPDEPVEVTVDFAEIRIEEPYAVIRHTASFGGVEGVLYAQRFDDRWLLCSDAESALEDSGTTPADPTD